MSTPQNVISMAQAEGAEFVDLRFTDVPGLQHHFSMPIRELTEDAFEQGLGFDGSSIRGFQSIDLSDMLLIPDPDTAFMDPFMARPTVVVLCYVMDPITREMYNKDPRVIAKKAVDHLVASGIADTAYFGPEAEFFIFDRVTFLNTPNKAGFEIQAEEAIWSSADPETVGGVPNPGHKIAPKMGYFPLAPLDRMQDLRAEMVSTLERVGIEIEIHHHEVGTAGQAEIDMRFDDMLRMADNLQLYKYVVKNVADRAGRSVTFMPKPIFGDNGSGMHVHQSLWKDGEALFHNSDGYAGLSEMALHYVGGLLQHAPALLAFGAPTTNSYRRLVPGYEAPVNLVYSSRNRSAAIRIPVYSDSPKAKRVEFRCPDPAANPYLAFAAMLMAGLDGIKKAIDPGEPLDQDLYALSEEEAAAVLTVPGSLRESLDALVDDADFLLEGGVFSEGLIEAYVEGKQEEIDAVNLMPTPLEFELYYSI